MTDETGVTPEVNQIRLSPPLAREAGRDFAAEYGIRVESRSPIGRGGDLLAEPAIVELARRYDRTPAQIVLRWHLAPSGADPGAEVG